MSFVEEMRLVKLIIAVRRAIERGDTLVMRASELGSDELRRFRLLKLFNNAFDIPLCDVEDKILLALKPSGRAITATGQEIGILSYHEGVYYSERAHRFREKDIAWVMEKPLP